MAAPAVQNLQDVVSSLTAANQPNLDNLSQQDQNISDSATASTAALKGQQADAFSNITGQANARGMAFSGFTPDEQAKYTSNTYLPALAKLQQSITDSRTALAGQKAKIISDINNQGYTQVQGEKTALQQWQDQQDKIAADQAFQSAQLDKTQKFQDEELGKTQGFTDTQRQATEAFQAEQARQANANALSVAGVRAANTAASSSNKSEATAQRTQNALAKDINSATALFNKNGGTLPNNQTRESVIAGIANKYYGSEDANGNPISDEAINRAIADQIYGQLRYANEPKYTGLPSDWKL